MVSAIEYVADEKGISKEKAHEAVEAALAAAYKKEFRGRSEVIRASLSPKSGDLKFFQVKTVVTADEVEIPSEDGALPAGEIRPEKEEDALPRYNPDRHILLEEARVLKPDAVASEEMLFPLESHSEFGRIAAQTAKQVILQSLREAEKDSIKEEYAGKAGEIVSGVIQRFERGNIFVDLGRVVGVMFYNESIPGEHYRVGQRMRFLVLAVQEEERHRPGIVLSRSHPNFIKKLFELEVPEIMDGAVEIKSIAREPGSRTKIAVVSYQDAIDPIGAVVGQRGTRVIAVTNELGSEKIDVVEWSDDPEEFVANALLPARAKLVEVGERREAMVLVPEDQLSLAIGRSGQNVRLAAKLTGWKIDVRSQSRPDEELEGGSSAGEEEIDEKAERQAETEKGDGESRIKN